MKLVSTSVLYRFTTIPGHLAVLLITGGKESLVQHANGLTMFLVCLKAGVHNL